jgi:hypothetical protein
MDNKKDIKVGIGFATGRKSFQKVLRSYIYNWKESGLVDNNKIQLNVFVAYDLTYNQTVKKDYINIHPELLKHINGMIFIGTGNINEEINHLVAKNVIEITEAKKIFGKGYASQRNALIYSAIKNGMDYLIFLDDDEYPVAVTNARKNAVWGGEHVLSSHIQHIEQADFTHGYHCGYISPIPFVEYNDKMTETDFRYFIEAISNDILNWDNIKQVMNNGGVTYADKEVLATDDTQEVQEINKSKFISGSNLGINLTDPQRVFPFYNPPGARGEDTFLSTCLSERKVIKVPCYTFHDGFSTYKHLLEGVLPIKLKFIRADNDKIVDRFYKACIGWIRYKPLLLLITQPDDYKGKIEEMRQQLKAVLPKVCLFFDQPNFMNILTELDKYDRNVNRHYKDFVETQLIWKKIMNHFVK